MNGLARHLAPAKAAAIAGCGCGCGGAAGACCANGNGNGKQKNNGSSIPIPIPMSANEVGLCPGGYLPYENPLRDAALMSEIVGEVVVPVNTTSAPVNIEPTQGYFDACYVEVVAVDNADPNTQVRVELGRWFQGDCPVDCRTANVWSDQYDPNTGRGCCCGMPRRFWVGKTANGQQVTVTVTNPLGGVANARVKIVLRGFCHRMGAC